LAAEGAAIAALDMNSESLPALIAALPGKTHAWAVADVNDRDGLRAAVAQLRQQLGPIDMLIASAGIGIETTALDFRAEDMEALIRVNLIGVSNSIAAVLPEMLARKRGHLVALSSLASYRGLPHMAGYCASKAGVSALMDSLRVELRSHGIAATTICPGWVRTPLTSKFELPMPGLLEVEDAVRRMVKAIRKRKAHVAFPRYSAFQVRMLRWLPPAWSDWLLRKLFGRLMKKHGFGQKT
jgi:short-subunit dehydrogenase